MCKNGLSQSGLWLSLSAEFSFVATPAVAALCFLLAVSLLGPASLVWSRWRLAAAGPQASWRGRSGSVARQRALVPEVATGSALPFPPPERREESCSPGSGAGALVRRNPSSVDQWEGARGNAAVDAAAFSMNITRADARRRGPPLRPSTECVDALWTDSLNLSLSVQPEYVSGAPGWPHFICR
ncbi:hypothetical protein MTO96_016676 [Rhipicephalus appendiculatus]